jgi:hypothetical protein
MFRALAILASIIGAAAFAPAARMARSSALKMSFTDEAGALPPVGFWDPLGKFVTNCCSHEFLSMPLLY